MSHLSLHPADVAPGSAGVTLAIPPSLSLCQLEEGGPLAEDCRHFCLRTIKSTYGYDYRPDWHDDLDSLRDAEESHYAPCNRGAFFVLRDTAGQVVGTAGMRGLCYKPLLAAMFARRYPDIDRVAFNGRLYVDPAWRRQGLGNVLIGLREQAARRMGYTTVYIHCDAKATRLRQYWGRLGFQLISEGRQRGALRQSAVICAPAAGWRARWARRSADPTLFALASVGVVCTQPAWWANARLN